LRELVKDLAAVGAFELTKVRVKARWRLPVGDVHG